MKKLLKKILSISSGLFEACIDLVICLIIIYILNLFFFSFKYLCVLEIIVLVLGIITAINDIIKEGKLSFQKKMTVLIIIIEKVLISVTV